MENQELQKLLDILIKFFDSRYRKINDCNDITDAADQRQDKLEIRFAEGITKLNILIAILSMLAAPVIGVCVKYLFGGR